MTVSSDPWQHPNRQRSALSLTQIPTSILHSLASGTIIPEETCRLTPYLIGPECAGLWRMRSEQLTDTPDDAPWVTRFVLVPGETAPVGLAGFHGRPDANGMVEVGYRIDPDHRRKGYARQSLEILLAIAQADADVKVVRATISPENVASRALVEGYGFREIGEQWDEEDGLELILELTAQRKATH